MAIVLKTRSDAEDADSADSDDFLDNLGGGRPARVDAAEAVAQLAERLPSVGDVQERAETDTSPLTEAEQRQRAETEEVIRQAQTAGKTAVWVIGQAAELAARGRWWRSTHRTFGEYLKDTFDISASYARRVRASTPLALAAIESGAPSPNEGQARELKKAEKRYDRQTALDLYRFVGAHAATAGRSITAEVLAKVRESLPPALPDNREDAREVIDKAARTFFTKPGVPIGTRKFEEESNEGDGQESGVGQSADAGGTSGRRTLPPLDEVAEGLEYLRRARKILKRGTLESACDQDAERYRELRQDFSDLTASLSTMAKRAPWPAREVDGQATP